MPACEVLASAPPAKRFVAGLDAWSGDAIAGRERWKSASLVTSIKTCLFILHRAKSIDVPGESRHPISSPQQNGRPRIHPLFRRTSARKGINHLRTDSKTASSVITNSGERLRPPFVAETDDHRKPRLLAQTSTQSSTSRPSAAAARILSEARIWSASRAAARTAPAACPAGVGEQVLSNTTRARTYRCETAFVVRGYLREHRGVHRGRVSFCVGACTTSSVRECLLCGVYLLQ